MPTALALSCFNIVNKNTIIPFLELSALVPVGADCDAALQLVKCVQFLHHLICKSMPNLHNVAILVTSR